jgi:hypothetical protein
MRGFTIGSSSGWAGLLSQSTALVRVLDVAVEDERPHRITLAISPSTDGEHSSVPAPVIDAEAIVEWGTTDGTTQRAIVDVGAGTTFGVNGTRAIVTLRSIELTSRHPRETRYRATASFGESREHFPPLRAVRIGALAAGVDSERKRIPDFARRVFLSRTPQERTSVRFFDGVGDEISLAQAEDGEEPALIVPPGAHAFLLINGSATPLVRACAVFELALG